VVNWSELVAGLFPAPPPAPPKPKANTPAPAKKDEKKEEEPEAKDTDDASLRAKALAEMTQALKAMPPLVVSISRTPTEVKLAVRQRDLNAASAKVINRAMDWFQRTGRRNNPYGIQDDLPIIIDN
jgi:outer membrane biosynthesis protein TonB